MEKRPDPHYRHRLLADLIRHAVWLYHGFRLSLQDVELPLAERGVIAHGAIAWRPAGILPRVREP